MEVIDFWMQLLLNYQQISSTAAGLTLFKNMFVTLGIKGILIYSVFPCLSYMFLLGSKLGFCPILDSLHGAFWLFRLPSAITPQ